MSPPPAGDPAGNCLTGSKRRRFGLAEESPGSFAHSPSIGCCA